MDRLKQLIVNYFAHFLLSSLIVKSHFMPAETDLYIILGLILLTGFRMFINSVFDVKVKVKIDEHKEKVEATIQNLMEIIDNNNKSYIDQINKLSLDHAAEIQKIKTDVGQINVSQGIQNGQEKIFF